MAPIFLLSDFGYDDIYAGIIRATILSFNPDAKIYDLTHGIEKYNVRQAAYRLAVARPFLPMNSVVVAVVDPGVGGTRRLLAARVDGKVFLCPDNGILSLVLAEKQLESCVILDRSDFHLSNKSATFHGRDILAPVAALISSGESLSDVGTPVSTTSLTLFTYPQVESTGARESSFGLLDVDSFGNLITSLHQTKLDPAVDRSQFVVSAGSHCISGLHEKFTDVPPGVMLAYFGSAGFLEIAVCEGSARFLIGPVDRFTITF